MDDGPAAPTDNPVTIDDTCRPLEGSEHHDLMLVKVKEEHPKQPSQTPDAAVQSPTPSLHPATEAPVDPGNTPWCSKVSNTTQGTKRSHDLISHDGETSVEPYDPSKEALPKKEVNHSSFRLAEDAASSIPEEILAIIGEKACASEDMSYIKGLANSVLSPNYPNGVRVGLRGDSGTGKSSIINSLLGIPNIAPQGDDGAACTSVVQEFSKPRHNQQHACEAEISFLTPNARKAILQEWLSDVYVFEHSGIEAGDDAFESLEQASSTAIEGMYSLFCDHDECHSPEAAQKFLAGAKSQKDAGIISKLEGWTNKLLDNLRTDQTKVVINDISPEMIQHKLARYLQHDRAYSNNECIEPSPWPFVKLVRMYFDSPILSQDIVLVDLPGTSDVNQTRVKASQQYLNDVQTIGVVAKVDRVETDSDTHNYLIDAFRRKRSANVLMIATGSDTVNTRPAQLQKKINTADPVEASNLMTLRDQIDMTNLELKNVGKGLNAARARRDRDAMEELSEKREMLEVQRATQEARLSGYCVKLRNEKVSRFVRQRYADLTKDRVPLPMFCVSNSEYTSHTLGYDKKFPPKISIEGTGVPALRAFLYGLPAMRKWRAFEYHRNIILPSLLNNLEMTCSQTKLMRRDEMQRILLSASEDIETKIETIFDGIFKTVIVPGIATIKTKKLAYAEHAVSQLSKWKDWATGTHKTFCIHKGYWSTKKVGKNDWNRDFLEPLIKAVENDTKSWAEASNAIAQSLTEDMSQRIDKLISSLEATAGSSKASMKAFFDELRTQNRNIDVQCQTRAEMVEKDLNTIRERITNTTDTNECYFVKIMAQVYSDCGAIGGRGAREMKADRLRTKLSEKVRGPFLELFNTARSAASEVFQRHSGELAAEVNEMFGGFNLTFMRAFKTDETDTPEIKKLRVALQSKVEDWRKKLENDVGRHLLTCAEYARG